MRYCHFGVSPVNYSDSDYANRTLFFFVQRITPKIRAKVYAQCGMSLSSPGSLLATDCSKVVVLVKFLLNVLE